MINKFYKYQSVGNDFVLFDFYDKDYKTIKQIINSNKWKPFVKKICKRNFNIGADGVLILKKENKKEIPELLIYNADGTKAEICLNGLRCASRHLKEYHDIGTSFKFKIGDKNINCTIDGKNIVTKVPNVTYNGKKTIKINSNNKEIEISGSMLNAGNPHFIVNIKKTKEWIKKNGKSIESHEEFPNKTNVEFIWKKSFNSDNKHKAITNLNVLVYERGVGPTLSCSSGATAITWLLYQQKKIEITQKINLFFEGGVITCWIDSNLLVNLQAEANLVFKGNRT